MVQARVPDLDSLPFHLGPLLAPSGTPLVGLGGEEQRKTSDLEEYYNFITKTIPALATPSAYNDAAKLKELEKEYKDKVPTLRGIVRRIRRFPKFYFHPGITPGHVQRKSSLLTVADTVMVSFLNDDLNYGVVL